VGHYSQHPDAVHTPLESVLKAFKVGTNKDGLLDSQLPDLLSVMSQISNSRDENQFEKDMQRYTKLMDEYASTTPGVR